MSLAFLLGCGPHVLSGTAVLLLPRNRGTAGSEVQPGGCACVLHLCCQAIVLAGTSLHRLDELREQIRLLESKHAQSRAAATTLRLLLLVPLLRRGQHGQVARSIASWLHCFAPCLLFVLAGCVLSRWVRALLLPPGPPTSAFVEVPDLNLCAECALLPLRSTSPDEVEPTRLVELWSEAVLGSGCRCCIPCEPLELLLTVS